MTRWDEMSPRERDALVAEEVMGWAVNRSERGWHTIGVTPKRLIGPSKCRLPGDCWNPWERIEHAWEVVEEMLADGWDPRIENLDTWSATFVRINDGTYHFADADTAPEAICKAALEAKGVDL